MSVMDQMTRVSSRNFFLSSSASQSFGAWSITICHHQHFERLQCSGEVKMMERTIVILDLEVRVNLKDAS